MLDGLRFALTTLTVFPVRGPAALDRRTAAWAMSAAPAVGLLLAVPACLVLYLARRVEVPAVLPCVLAIGALALLTRGLHLDGVADLADGLGSSRDEVGTRAVMKSPEVGAFGVVSLIFVVLLQVSALLGCIHQGRATAALLLSVAVGRLAITAACRSTPAATTEGMGAVVAQTVPRGVTTGWLLLLTGAFAAFATVDPDAHGSSTTAVVRTVVAVSAALIVARLLRRHAVRRVGGLSGDVLGAVSEVATTVCLVVLSAS